MSGSAELHARRAGILVTGTEVLTGIISDRNGPWLSERLREHRRRRRDDPDRRRPPRGPAGRAALHGRSGMALIVTSGGLGPTADDLTAEVVGQFAGREMVLDDALEERIAEILRPLMSRWPGLDPRRCAPSNRKQAVMPRGATVLEPVGTAPGLVVPPADGRRSDGRGAARAAARAAADVGDGAWPPRRSGPRSPARPTYRRGSCGCSGSPSPRSPRRCGRPRRPACAGRRSRSRPACGAARSRSPRATSRRREGDYEALVEFIGRAPRRQLFSPRRRDRRRAGRTALVASGRTVAVAESCTGGLMAARLTERAGSSEYFAGRGGRLLQRGQGVAGRGRCRS